MSDVFESSTAPVYCRRTLARNLWSPPPVCTNSSVGLPSLAAIRSLRAQTTGLQAALSPKVGSCRLQCATSGRQRLCPSRPLMDSTCVRLWTKSRGSRNQRPGHKQSVQAIRGITGGYGSQSESVPERATARLRLELSHLLARSVALSVCPSSKRKVLLNRKERAEPTVLAARSAQAGRWSAYRTRLKRKK